MNCVINLLSVDFDFWVEPLEFQDWSYKEAMFWIEQIWNIRAIDNFAYGRNPCETIFIAKDEPAPGLFGQFLVKHGLTSKKNAVAFAESHLMAYKWFEGFKDINLIHIDAHHDFGYNIQELNCDNWVAYLVKAGKIKKITLIYPKWRQRNEHLKEWGSEAEKIAQEWRKQGVEVNVGYGLEENMPSNLPISKTFICRSGTWTPPWLDDEFRMLVGSIMSLGRHTRHALFNYPSLEKMFKRKVDMEAAKAAGEQQGVLYRNSARRPKSNP